jgi:UDP-glucose 4-epimerase
MRALITGGAGFIGSTIAKELASNGAEVIVLDNLSSAHR